MQNHYDIFVIDFGDPEYGETNFGIYEIYQLYICGDKKSYKKRL